MKPSSLPTSRPDRAGQRYYPIIILSLLILPALACSLANPRYELNNEIRLAVFEYMRQTYGPVHDLVVHFDRGEPRIRFDGQNQNGGHTVWLYPLGAEEYFATRPGQDSYLYIQKIEVDDARRVATTTVYYGNGQSYQGRQLTLTLLENGGWVITDDVEVSQQ